MPPDSPSFCIHANVCTWVQVPVSGLMQFCFHRACSFSTLGWLLMSQMKTILVKVSWTAYKQSYLWMVECVQS